ncbi:MAG TPA: energy transducer TonB [Candidatus Sulfotelmatobacter sp.]
MIDLDLFLTKTKHRLPADPRSQRPDAPKQQRMMVIALALLIAALAFTLYRDRDFWFPETQEAADQSQDEANVQSQVQPASAVAANPDSSAHKKSHGAKAKAKADAPADAPDDPPVIATRTVLPPLEVEVVAGDVHRVVRPGTNSVRVDLQPGSPPHPVPQPPSRPADTAASATTSAAEHVQIYSDTAEIVSQPVKPSYPMLARQMKVQGSVILQALISRSGEIQDLRVVSGPPILANAAQEAVKQWHFKPHFQGTEPVETQTRITVNFTISTN